MQCEFRNSRENHLLLTFVEIFLNNELFCHFLLKTC